MSHPQSKAGSVDRVGSGVVVLFLVGLWLHAIEVGATPAESWRAFMHQPEVEVPKNRYPYQHCFEQAAKKYQIPLVLLLAVARGESGFDPKARSGANAYGLMQILWPDTARDLGIRRLSELLDPCTNVDAGAKYLHILMTKYNGDVHRVLAAYNYGPARIDKAGNSIPKGANWYSGYIYRNLQAILGKIPQGEGRLFLIAFDRPYRAVAFLKYIHSQAPTLRVHWTKRKGKYWVVLFYRSRKELEASKRNIKRIGFEIDS